MKRSFAIALALVALAGACLAGHGDLETTLYLGRYFEVRNHEQPVKYVFNGDTRVSRVIGTLNADLRVQRLRLFPGWNFCSLAVTATNVVGQLANSSTSAMVSDLIFAWDPPTRTWSEVVPGEPLGAGSVLSIFASTNANLSLVGAYVEPTNRPLQPEGDFLPCAGLETWPLDASNFPAATLATFDAPGGKWSPCLPAPVQQQTNFSTVLSPGGAVFVQVASASEIEAPASALRIRYYHQDHLGSSGVVADADGNAIEETAYYPFGVPRHQHSLEPANEPYSFTQKERDAESLLHCVGHRYLPAALGRFASTDPKFVHPDELDSTATLNFLRNPQMLNLYAYALSNPLKFIDPSGLEVVWSEKLLKDKTFQKAFKILQDTTEGKRILAALENADVTADMGKLPGNKGIETHGKAHSTAWLEGTRRRKRREAKTVITIDIEKAKKAGLTPYELANVLHHELRHAEIHHTDEPGDDNTTEEGLQRSHARRKKLHDELDVYFERNNGTGRGNGVQNFDKRNVDFQKEILLLPQDYCPSPSLCPQAGGSQNSR